MTNSCHFHPFHATKKINKPLSHSESRRVLELCARRVTSCGRAATRVMAVQTSGRCTALDKQHVMFVCLFASCFKFLIDAKAILIQHTTL